MKTLNIMIVEILKPAILLFIVLSLITGLLYPILITSIAQIIFPYQANGSLIKLKHKDIIVGSELIGQNFDDNKYFWGRPSASSPMPNNALASGGSNLSAGSKTLSQNIAERINIIRKANIDNVNTPIPIELAASSASGLDPHISLTAAYYQAKRIAVNRNISLNKVYQLINNNTQSDTLGKIGFGEEKIVNVLKLNLALDDLHLQ